MLKLASSHCFTQIKKLNTRLQQFIFWHKIDRLSIEKPSQNFLTPQKGQNLLNFLQCVLCYLSDNMIGIKSNNAAYHYWKDRIQSRLSMMTFVMGLHRQNTLNCSCVKWSERNKFQERNIFKRWSHLDIVILKGLQYLLFPLMFRRTSDIISLLFLQCSTGEYRRQRNTFYLIVQMHQKSRIHQVARQQWLNVMTHRGYLRLYTQIRQFPPPPPVDCGYQ